MIDVVWLDYRPNSNGRGYWDQGLLELMFSRKLWPTAQRQSFTHHNDFDWHTAGAGALVVFKAGNNADQLVRLNHELRMLEWVILVLAGDEESLVDQSSIHHPNMVQWIALPRPTKHNSAAAGTRYFGCGIPADAVDLLPLCETEALQRPLDFVFQGQMNHTRRVDCVDATTDIPNGLVQTTSGFTQGVNHSDYYQALASSKIALCPAGPTTPDSFRLWEALEAGCLPFADAMTPGNTVPGYWKFLTGGSPFPVISDWSGISHDIQSSLRNWPENANGAFAWWQNWKRDMAYWLIEDLAKLNGPTPEPGSDITVLITASACPSMPSTELIDETITSIRAQLPDAEIIVLLDGVRFELMHRWDDFQEFTRRLLWSCNHKWTGVLPIIFDKHTHQAGMVSAALRKVKTKFLLFAELDTPIGGEIDWHGLQQALASGEADVIRLYPGTDLEPEHRNMIFDRVDVCGVPLTRTSQFSSRPHLATTTFYRRMMTQYFAEGEIMFIELRMHSVCASMWHDDGLLGWFQCRLWIYTPDAGENKNIQRSWHTDGRGTDPAFPT